MKKLWFVLLFFLCPRLPAQTPQWAGVLAPSRAIDWSNAGVTGGIPSGSWSQCVTAACQTVTTNGASSTAAQIQAAWASAPANSYVLLPAGTYSGVTSLSLSGISSVALRGAGADQTIIPGPITVSNSGSNNKSAPVSVSGTTTQGSNTLTLSAVTNLKVGSIIAIDQNDSLTDNGGVLVLGTSSSYTGPFTAPGSAGPYSSQGESTGQNARCASLTSPSNCFHQEQFSIVTQCDGVTTAGHACSSGANITISPSLHMSNWSPSNTMSAWWAATPVQYDGIEDLTADETSSGGNGLTFNWCSSCWAKGIAVYDTNLYHVQFNFGTNDTVANSYFFLTQNSVTSSYGVVCNSDSNLLVENNIFHGVSSPVIWNGSCEGNVVGYNYNVNDYYSGSSGYSINFYGEHAAGDSQNLVEGNISSYLNADNIHGTSNLGTYFRNVLTGPSSVCWSSGSPFSSVTWGACNNGLMSISLYAFHRFFNIIGNVLGGSGQSGVDTNYITNADITNNGAVLLLGAGNGGVPNDPNVQSTLMLWGNADAFNGFTSPRFNCSEVPSGLTGTQATYANPCPASHTLPASLYYNTIPAWWPSGKPFPIIGPDVSGGNIVVCSSGTYARSLVNSVSMCTGGTGSTGMAGLVYSNPAMDCYLGLGGLPNGTGPRLANFNESACYAQTVSGNPPQPPTNVKATAQ